MMLKRVLHFLCAIKSSALILIVSVILISMSVFFIVLTDNSQVVSFFVGIVASVIATLVLKIVDKYEKSIATCCAISMEIERILIFYEENICGQAYDSKKCSSNLYQFYISICSKSIDITYLCDFLKISNTINNMIKLVKENKNIEDKIKELEEHKVLLQFK